MLQEMLVKFHENNDIVAGQCRDLRRSAAKARAYQCVLDIKILTMRIINGLLNQTGTRAEDKQEKDALTLAEYQKRTEDKYESEIEGQDRQIELLNEELTAKEIQVEQLKARLRRTDISTD